MAFRDLRAEVAELFADEAPSLYSRRSGGINGMRHTTDPELKVMRTDAWKAAHPKRHKEMCAKYRKAHAAEIKKRNAAYYQKNKAKWAGYNAKRDAARKIKSRRSSEP